MVFRPGAHLTVNAIAQAPMNARIIQFQGAEIVDVVYPLPRSMTYRRVTVEEIGSAISLELVSSPGCV